MMETRTEPAPFIPYVLAHGLIADMSEDRFPTTLSAWASDVLNLPAGATHFGYIYEGSTRVVHASGQFELGSGMYFSAHGETVVHGAGAGIVVSRLGYDGFFHIGGPVEERGRLKYIDGCTDSLLIPPVMLGDPCLNLLYFPPGVTQTQHVHPSMRVGMVIRGEGECATAFGRIPLLPGRVFVIPADGLHGFITGGSSMTVIAYHPDSDFGPTHEAHPMINRTIVEGLSASQIPEIRTR